MTNLQQARAKFTKADHGLQLAMGNGDPTGIRNAITARRKAYNCVAKLVKANLVK